MIIVNYKILICEDGRNELRVFGRGDSAVGLIQHGKLGGWVGKFIWNIVTVRSTKQGKVWKINMF